MKSSQAKVLHEVFFAPMVHHVVTATSKLLPDKTVVIVGHQSSKVQQSLSLFEVNFALQKEQLGTGHAVLSAADQFDNTPGTVMILCGDTPLVRSSTLEQMLDGHVSNSMDLTLLTTIMNDPTNYGRIITDGKGQVKQIVEQKDANQEQREIKEINGGIYCVDKQFLFSALQKIGTDNSQGEVYLTDIVQIAVDDGLKVGKYIVEDSLEVLGVNSRPELAAAQMELQLRRNHALMLEGVTMYNPESIRISPSVTVGNDTIIEAGVTLSGKSEIGSCCIIKQGAIIEHCNIEDHCEIGAYSHLTEHKVPKGTKLPSHSITPE